MPLLPSLDQQLRSAREASDSKFMVSHIDTCLSCYLHDHHNRDGELLLGVFVDGAATIGQVLDGLRDEYRQIAYEMGSNRLGFDYDAGLAAIDSLIAENEERSGNIFDSSLEITHEDDDGFGEGCQAWFLIHWDIPEEEDDASDC